MGVRVREDGSEVGSVSVGEEGWKVCMCGVEWEIGEYR